LWLVEVRRGKQLSQTLECLVDVSVQEPSGDKHLLASVSDVSVVCRLGKAVNLYFKAISATHKSIVEVVVAVIFRAD